MSPLSGQQAMFRVILCHCQLNQPHPDVILYICGVAVLTLVPHRSPKVVEFFQVHF